MNSVSGTECQRASGGEGLTYGALSPQDEREFGVVFGGIFGDFGGKLALKLGLIGFDWV